jgi:hypothetical protein
MKAAIGENIRQVTYDLIAVALGAGVGSLLKAAISLIAN